MATLIPHPSSAKRNDELRRVLTMIAPHSVGLSVREIADGMRMSQVRIEKYVTLMLCNNVIDRHKPRLPGRKVVYRHFLTADAAGIDAFLLKLAHAFAKPVGQQRQSIRMPDEKPARLRKPEAPRRHAVGKVITALIRSYDFFADEPNSMVRDLAYEFDMPLSSARSRIDALIARGCIEETEMVTRGKYTAQAYRAITGMRPGKGMPMVDAEDDRPTVHEFKRPIVKAKQLGMAPYGDLPAAFFNPTVGA